MPPSVRASPGKPAGKSQWEGRGGKAAGWLPGAEAAALPGERGGAGGSQVPTLAPSPAASGLSLPAPAHGGADNRQTAPVLQPSQIPGGAWDVDSGGQRAPGFPPFPAWGRSRAAAVCHATGHGEGPASCSRAPQSPWWGVPGVPAVSGDEAGGVVTGADATAEQPWLGDRKSGRWSFLSAVIYGAAQTQTGRCCPGNGLGWLQAVSSARGEQCSPKAAPAERGLSAWLCSLSPGSLCLRPGDISPTSGQPDGAQRFYTRTRGGPGGSRDVPMCQEQDSALSHLVPPAPSPARGCRCLRGLGSSRVLQLPEMFPGVNLISQGQEGGRVGHGQL